MLEVDLLERLTSDGQLAGYQREYPHMDTISDKQGLERLWAAGTPPWRRWSEPCGGEPYAAACGQADLRQVLDLGQVRSPMRY